MRQKEEEHRRSFERPQIAGEEHKSGNEQRGGGEERREQNGCVNSYLGQAQ